ncbi:hypothetical protein Bbelb_056230 [Branchiostoma belcheri]|nr:hypothetical protein Bbelb_056230 [Branchiostoma belcheri]
MTDAISTIYSRKAQRPTFSDSIIVKLKTARSPTSKLKYHHKAHTDKPALCTVYLFVSHKPPNPEVKEHGIETAHTGGTSTLAPKHWNKVGTLSSMAGYQRERANLIT